MLYVMFYVIMTSGPMVQHSTVGPGECTAQATHDDVSKVYVWGEKFRNFISEQLGLQQY